MTAPDTQSMVLWPLAVYFFAIVGLTAVLLGVSYLLGPRTRGRATQEIFESGIVTLGNARFRVPAKFYLVAMLFVIFDIESVFLYAWAVAVREAGWAGYVEAMVFIVILLAALVYLWRIGALDWAPKGRRHPTATKEARDAVVAE